MPNSSKITKPVAFRLPVDDYNTVERRIKKQAIKAGIELSEDELKKKVINCIKVRTIYDIGRKR